MSNPTLYYFDVEGRAESIRLAFTVGGIEFEDFRIPHDQWVPKYKSLCPSGQVPVLEIGGKKYCESSALLMYAGKRSGLIPEDPLDLMTMWQAMMSLEQCWPVLTPIYSAGPETREKVLAEQTEVLRGLLEKYCSLVSKSQHADGYLAGDKLSVADMNLYGFTRGLNGRMLGMNIDFTPYKAIKKVIDLVENHPKIVSYYASKKK